MDDIHIVQIDIFIQKCIEHEMYTEMYLEMSVKGYKKS